jgi:cell division protein FtsZ
MFRTANVPGSVKIKVVGLGGAGCNAVTRMVQEHIRGVDFIAMNTDTRHLAITEAATRIQLGKGITQGLGAGGEYAYGLRAAEESGAEIEQAIGGADMIFITAGMGGGTGTGAAPFVAELAMKSGALTVAIVTKPFKFEGNHRMQVAEEGIKNLAPKVDTLIIVPNERLLELADPGTSVESAFKMADEVLFQGVKSIAEIIMIPGLINIDFASVRTVMKDAGPAWISIGKASGANRAIDAAKNALTSRLMDISVEGATRVLYNITGGDNLTLMEVQRAAEIIQGAVDPHANIIFGVITDPSLGNEVRLTLIAAGFTNREHEIEQLLKVSKSEAELQVPPFLRQHR